MKEALHILLDFTISYALVFFLYYLLFIRKKTRYNKNKVPVELYYLVDVYKLDIKKIKYKKFIYTTAFINTFIIVFTYIVVFNLLNKFIWQLLCGVVIIVLLIIILYGLMGRYYQKRVGKNV